MNEYKLPTKKIWQLGSKDVELIKPVVSEATPTSAPTAIGITWISTTGPAIYISTGTASVADWRLIWD
jgi:hypothetical protein